MSDPLAKSMMIERRKRNPAPVLLAYAAKAIDHVWRANVNEGRRTDEIIVTHILAWISRAYARVTGFLLAHALGPVWGKTLEMRRNLCILCPDRKKGSDERYHCFGYPGGSCGCGQFWWWPFGALSWQQLLRNKKCVQGKFGRTRRLPLPVLPTERTCDHNSKSWREEKKLRPSAKGWVR